MMVISLFFWPSPAVALMGAVFSPVALRVGLPAIGVAVAMNLLDTESRYQEKKYVIIKYINIILSGVKHVV